MVVKFDDIRMIKLVHNFDLELDLLNKVMLHNFLFADNLDCIRVLAHFVAHFIHFAKATYTDVAVCETFKVVSAALTLLPRLNGWREEQNPVFNVVYF